MNDILVNITSKFYDLGFLYVFFFDLMSISFVGVVMFTKFNLTACFLV